MTSCEWCLNYVWDEEYGMRVFLWTKTKCVTAWVAARANARFFRWMMNTKSSKSRTEPTPSQQRMQERAFVLQFIE